LKPKIKYNTDLEFGGNTFIVMKIGESKKQKMKKKKIHCNNSLREGANYLDVCWLGYKVLSQNCP
jgi:hypothetical protein